MCQELASLHGLFKLPVIPAVVSESQNCYIPVASQSMLLETPL